MQGITHKQKTQWAGLLLLLLLSQIGCAKQYLVAEYVLQRKDVLPPLDSGSLQVASLETLARVKTVAFAPPSSCSDILTGDGRTAAHKDLLHSDCGVLMSELESAAQAVGYTVVSWKSLKAPVEQHAKQSGVQLLIMVNRLAVHDMLKDMYVKGRINFYEELADGTRRPLAVKDSTRVGKRCEVHAPIPDNNSEIAVVLDAQLVDPAARQVLWRHAYLAPSREDSLYVIDRYYRAPQRKSPDDVLCAFMYQSSTPRPVKPKGSLTGPKTAAGSTYTLGPIAREVVAPDIVPRLVRRAAWGFLDSVAAIRDTYKIVSASGSAAAKKRAAEAAYKLKRGNDAIQDGRLTDAFSDLTASLALAKEENKRHPEGHRSMVQLALRNAASTTDPERSQHCAEARKHLDRYREDAGPDKKNDVEALAQQVAYCGTAQKSMVRDP